jgi:hypothetical protein
MPLGLLGGLLSGLFSLFSGLLGGFLGGQRVWRRRRLRVAPPRIGRRRTRDFFRRLLQESLF